MKNKTSGLMFTPFHRRHIRHAFVAIWRHHVEYYFHQTVHSQLSGVPLTGVENIFLKLFLEILSTYIAGFSAPIRTDQEIIE